MFEAAATVQSLFLSYFIDFLQSMGNEAAASDRDGFRELEFRLIASLGFSAYTKSETARDYCFQRAIAMNGQSFDAAIL